MYTIQAHLNVKDKMIWKIELHQNIIEKFTQLNKKSNRTN